MKKNPVVWVNTICFNEENFIYYSVKSVIDFVDKVLIYDTGSDDKTVEVVKFLQKQNPGKIVFKEVGRVDRFQFTKIRQKMLDQTKSDWVVILDADEVWWRDSIKKLIEVIKQKGDKLDAIAVPFFTSVGDVYHHQEDKAGKYQILGRKGHLTIRAINRGVNGLRVDRPYGSEGYYSGDKEVHELQGVIFIEAPFLHLTHLKRTGSMNNLGKYKFDIGKKMALTLPEVLSLNPPINLPSPLSKRSSSFIVKSMVRFPIQYVWRRIR